MVVAGVVWAEYAVVSAGSGSYSRPAIIVAGGGASASLSAWVELASRQSSSIVD